MTMSSETKIDIGTRVSLIDSMTERAVSTFAKPCLIMGLVSALAISVMAPSIPIACIALGLFAAQLGAFAVATWIQGKSYSRDQRHY
ncbi:hypothetical protein [Maritimibacter alkaliphilus]|jgi:hypothetical protein|uniref:hypothetical protein n=1 Tax=Maritimibacter alkaliphilus TaxID=404236 RepID=UPI0003267A57|nr:hypothetical protein [Maritimibacter alkaliphilus]